MTSENDIALEEWKVARAATDKFDGMLSDLRKYSFSFITGLITAQAIFGFSGKDITLNIEIGAVIATMPLVVASYWLDRYYFGLLWGSVSRARFLEKYKLKTFNLTAYVSGFASSTKITSRHAIPVIYSLFLVSLLILGLFFLELFTKPLNEERLIQLAALLIGFGLNVFGILVVYTKHNVEEGDKQIKIKKLYEKYEKKVSIKKEHDSLKELEDGINKILEPEKNPSKPDSKSQAKMNKELKRGQYTTLADGRRVIVDNRGSYIEI